MGTGSDLGTRLSSGTDTGTGQRFGVMPGTGVSTSTTATLCDVWPSVAMISVH